MADEKKNPEGVKISFSDKVKVVATKEAKHLEEGKEYEIHPILADKLVKKGFAKIVK